MESTLPQVVLPKLEADSPQQQMTPTPESDQEITSSPMSPKRQIHQQQQQQQHPLTKKQVAAIGVKKIQMKKEKKTGGGTKSTNRRSKFENFAFERPFAKRLLIGGSAWPQMFQAEVSKILSGEFYDPNCIPTDEDRSFKLPKKSRGQMQLIVNYRTFTDAALNIVFNSEWKELLETLEMYRNNDNSEENIAIFNLLQFAISKKECVNNEHLLKTLLREYYVENYQIICKSRIFLPTL